LEGTSRGAVGCDLYKKMILASVCRRIAGSEKTGEAERPMRELLWCSSYVFSSFLGKPMTTDHFVLSCHMSLYMSSGRIKRHHIFVDEEILDNVE
jgi:hypothetical protein